MGHKEDRDRMKQTQIDRRKGKPTTTRVTRSVSRKAAPAPISEMPARPGGGDALLQEMRTRARRHFSLQSHFSAAFFAEKAMAVSQSGEDALFLARVHHASGAHARALHLLTSRKLERASAPARLLAGQCLLAAGSVMECLALIGEEDDPDAEPAISSTGRAAAERLRAVETSAPADVRALLCVLRARAYEALENAPRAELWLRRALAADPCCAEAFAALTGPGRLNARDSAALVEAVAAPARATAPAASPAVAGLFRVAADARAPLTGLPAPLRRSDDVLAAEAARRLAALDFAGAAVLARRLLARDPGADARVVCVLLAALGALGERQELFSLAHALVDARPAAGVAWLAVGHYYLASGAAGTARRYLHKATVLSPRLAEAWVAMGHAYAAQDESDHALSAYSTAARLYPAATFPKLCMGVQHARQSALGPACTLFLDAAEADPQDPAPQHEMGVIAFRMGDLRSAVQYFKDALHLWDAVGDDVDGSARPITGKRAEAQEISLVNLGHCHRRLREFPEAKRCYEKALALRPGSSATFVALGMTLHSMERYGAAIAMYHRALRFAPEDVICNELLERAMEDNVDLAGDDELGGALDGLDPEEDEDSSELDLFP